MHRLKRWGFLKLNEPLTPKRSIEMNTRTFTTSYRRTLFALLLAALLALSATVAQNQLSGLTGIGTASVAYACPGNSGGCG